MVNVRHILRRLGRSALVSLNPKWVKPRDSCVCITHRCNSRCQTCNVWYTPPIPDPPLETLLDWVQQFAEYGIRGTSISGGEPFLRQDLCQIVEGVHDYGLFCGLGTNGSLVSVSRLPDVDSCTVSIDGAYAATHDRIRGVQGSFHKAWQAVDYLQAHGIPVAINFVLQRANYRELPQLCHMAQAYGVAKVNVLPVSVGGFSQAAPDKERVFRHFDLKKLAESFRLAHGVGILQNTARFFDLVLQKLNGDSVQFACILQSIRFLIGADGAVYPCSLYAEPVGNLYEQTWEEIMHSPLTHQIQRECLAGACRHWGRCLSQELDSCLQAYLGAYTKFIFSRIKQRVMG